MPTASAPARLRFRRLNLIAILPILLVSGTVVTALQARSARDAVVLGLGVVAVAVAFERWSAGRIAQVAVPCLVVAAAVWVYGVFATAGEPQAAYFSIAVVGPLVVPELRRHRGLAAAVLMAYVGLAGAAGLLATVPSPGVREVVAYVVLPTGLTGAISGLMIPNRGFYDEVDELQRAGEREAELAVMRERMRFASDLHDIQGHTLHVVKLKVALARKLLDTDPERAGRELSQVYELVGDTIAQTRELAYGRRRLNLSAEVINARNLLEAAGIEVEIERVDEVDPQPAELLAQVLRETTTNVLRHAQARHVTIALGEHSLRVLNDGAEEDGPLALRGLATLRRRVAEQGGELHVSREHGAFRTEAVFGPAGASAAGASGAGAAGAGAGSPGGRLP